MSHALRLLFVDDDPADLELLGRVCRQAADDCIVRKVQEPVKVAPVLKSSAPHMVFVDHYLGALTGAELIRQYHSQYPHVAFVLLTGRSDEDVAVEAIRAGAADYLRKQEVNSNLLRALFERYDPAFRGTPLARTPAVWY